jgi:hypothetical protein
MVLLLAKTGPVSTSRLQRLSSIPTVTQKIIIKKTSV